MKKRPKGYFTGGSIGGGIMSGLGAVKAVTDLATAGKKLRDAKKDGSKGTTPPDPGAQSIPSSISPDQSSSMVTEPDEGGGGFGAARGGRIKRVAGKPIGKDDGLIPAQKGEYVVRKSAVNKLGTKALNTINRGAAGPG